MNITIRRTLAILLIIACSTPSLIRAQAFEGVVTSNVSVPMLGDQKIPITTSTKGDKSLISMDVPMQGNVKLYINKTTNKFTIVIGAQKKGYETDKADIDAMVKAMQFPTPKATGKKEKIMGYTTEEFVAPMPDGADMALWLTKDMPKDLSSAISATYQSMIQINGLKSNSFNDLLQQGYIPVRTVIKKDGADQAIIEFASAEPKKLDDKIFIIDSNISIQKVDPTMMKQNKKSQGSATANSKTQSLPDSSKSGAVMKKDDKN